MATANHNENFVLLNGKTKFMKVLMSASIAAEEGSAIYPDPGNAGQYTIADATTGNFIGILRQTIASTDSDYASTKMVTIEVPTESSAEWRFRVGSGTFGTTDVGKKVDFHTDGASLAVDGTSAPVALITKVISSTEGACIFLGAGVSGLPATT